MISIRALVSGESIRISVSSKPSGVLGEIGDIVIPATASSFNVTLKAENAGKTTLTVNTSRPQDLE